MLLTENDSKWASIIKEELGVKDANRISWMAKYAQIHEIKEAQQTASAPLSNGLFATPLNTLGMGNPMMPQGTGFSGGANATVQGGAGIGNTGADFHSANYVNGSGDVPMSTLPIAMTIAAQTIGFDLVPVVPAAGPWAMLQYFDTPYAGGKNGIINETSLDGKGAGTENKPIYIKLKTNDLANLAEIKNAWKADKDANASAATPVKLVVKVTAGNLVGELIGFSRIDAGILIKVAGINAEISVDAQGRVVYSGGDSNASIAEQFISNIKPVFTEVQGTITNLAGVTVKTNKYMPELVDGSSDHVQEFQNFASQTSTDLNEPMTRAENETGVGNTVGARIFTKMVQMGSYEVTGAVTRQQLQDMPLYGIDVVGKILEQMQNRISQAINNRILDRLFKLGCTNHAIQNAYQGVNLNISLNTAAAGTQDGTTSSKMVGIDGNAINMQVFAPADVAASANIGVVNLQRRISSRMLAAANIIANVSRRGRGNFVVTNTKVLTALQDAAGFVVAPMVNTLTQDGSQSLYFAGSIAGLNLYVDPNMDWEDTRVLVGKKGNGDEPGVIFMPYILADTVQTIVEGTMAPKMLMNSRFAIVDAGFYPEQSYLTFEVKGAEGLI